MFIEATGSIVGGKDQAKESSNPHKTKQLL